MIPMEYISCRKICYLGGEIIKYVDSNLEQRGKRLAYMMVRMLENKGGYDEYEIAEFSYLAFLSVIGDIGVKQLRIQPANELTSAMFATEFIRAYSPYEKRSDIIKYACLDKATREADDYAYADVAAILCLIKKANERYEQEGVEIKIKDFEADAGRLYPANDMMILLRCIRKDGILEKMEKGTYEQELFDYMDYLLFTNEEKEIFLDLVFRLIELKSNSRFLEARICKEITEYMAESLVADEKECGRLVIAAMFHDIGHLENDESLVNESGRLVEAMEKKYRQHVETGTQILRSYFRDDRIPELVYGHHERVNGSGYPAGRSNAELSRSVRMLQVSSFVARLYNTAVYPVIRDEEILDALEREGKTNHLDDRMVRFIIENYPEIKSKVNSLVSDYKEEKEFFKENLKYLMNQTN